MLFAADNVGIGYGKLEVLSNISLQVPLGSVISVIGPNGAGKSSLLKAIAGIASVRTGKMQWEGTDITNLSPQQIVRLGIALVPERRRIFGPLTVMENLELGAYHRFGRSKRDEINHDLDFVLSLFPILGQRRKQAGATLSGGEQQMLAIARGLMSKPKLLLLDEPSLGLAPLVIGNIYSVLRDLRKQGLSILLVEQNSKAALGISDYGYVLTAGRIVLQDTAANLWHNEDIQKIYLGVK